MVLLLLFLNTSRVKALTSWGFHVHTALGLASTNLVQVIRAHENRLEIGRDERNVCEEGEDLEMVRSDCDWR